MAPCPAQLCLLLWQGPAGRKRLSTPGGGALAYLGSKPHFTAIVVVLNLISAAGVVWYYRLAGPGALRYFLDYNYFLYFLVFHVTFSFRPSLRSAGHAMKQ